ncbi:hypothetical protein PENTCL1PPCAC_9386 [Pristionchus entomophagus]|uniref:Mothers against decapentaplegic homolog n=1 Tax=Pristionchus entomophagus TaxID=358040 RepID=A0AAV5SVJ6_9BILA|nr:hypothetical protein PENTCL1PPCAC_9386 [Pristionchus entomophagus]
MDMPGVFYHHSDGSEGGGVPPNSQNSNAPFYNEQEPEMYPPPQGTNDQDGSGDAPGFDNWFLNDAMDYQSGDSPEAVQQVQQGAGSGSPLSMGMMMEQQRTMQGHPDLQQPVGPMGVQHVQPIPGHLQQQQMFGSMPGHMPPFLNYDSMGLMPAGAHHLPQQPQPHSATAAAAAALFPGPQIFAACSSHVGSSLSIPSTSYLPFDHMQLSLAHHHHPSTSMSQQHQQQMQHVQQQQHAVAASAAALNIYSASASDSSSQITTVLMAFRQGGEEPEFVRKAIESLVKKLKDKRLELEALIQAVTSNGKNPTGCVTIQRSLDGRLQVAGRKGVPHVVYARIWRWPNVSKTELAKLPTCRVTSDNQDFICINPYHYERVVSNAGGMMASSEQQQPKQQAAAAAASASGYGMSMFDGRGDDWAAQMPPSTAAAIQAEMRQQQLLQRPGDAAEFRSKRRKIDPLFPAQHPLMHRSHTIDLNRVQIPAAAHYPEHWATISYFELDTMVGESFKVRREMMSITVDGGLDPQGERNGRFCIGSIPNVHRQSAVDTVRMHIGPGVVLKQHQDGRVTMEVNSNKAVFLRAPYIDYVKNTLPSTTHKVQKGDGEITIFDLRWAYYEMCERTASAKESVVAQARAVAGLPVNHPGMQQMSEMVAGSGVDEMKRMFCTVGMSFVKGFGGIYNRKTIKDCPCWIEVELHRPLQLLDQLLKRSYI